jgi:large subunit ribosomal protein L20
MPRIRKGAARRHKLKKLMKSVRGHYGATSRRHKLAITARIRAGVFAARDRRVRKRMFRQLWITRLAAACRQRGIRYSQLIPALAEAKIDLNRKMLSEIAIADPAAFDAILAKAGLATATK